MRNKGSVVVNMVENTELVPLNGSLAEAVSGTIKEANLKIPNSAGVSKVFLVSSELQISFGGAPTATTADMVAAAVVIAGKVTPTITEISQAGGLHGRIKRKLSNATIIVGESYEGPEQKAGTFPINKDSSGEYYVTVAIKSANAAAVSTVHYRLDFLLVR